MRLLASRAKTVKRLEDALDADDDASFLKAFAEVANRGYGKATEHVEHSGTVTQYVVEAPTKFTDRTTWQRQYSTSQN